MESDEEMQLLQFKADAAPAKMHANGLCHSDIRVSQLSKGEGGWLRNHS